MLCLMRHDGLVAAVRAGAAWVLVYAIIRMRGDVYV